MTVLVTICLMRTAVNWGPGRGLFGVGTVEGIQREVFFNSGGTPRVTTEIFSHATVFIPNKLQTNLYLIQTCIYNLLS